MTATYEVAITDADWTDLTQGNLSGFMTIWGDKDILYRQDDEAAVLTDVLVGHRLNSTSDFVSFLVPVGDVVFGRSIASEALVIVTPA